MSRLINKSTVCKGYIEYLCHYSNFVNVMHEHLQQKIANFKQQRNFSKRSLIIQRFVIYVSLKFSGKTHQEKSVVKVLRPQQNFVQTFICNEEMIHLFLLVVKPVNNGLPFFPLQIQQLLRFFSIKTAIIYHKGYQCQCANQHEQAQFPNIQCQFLLTRL